MNDIPVDFAILIKDFLERCGQPVDEDADGIEFSAEGYLVRVIPHPQDEGYILIEVEVGTIDPEELSENAHGLLAMLRFNDHAQFGSHWMISIDEDGTPIIRMRRSIRNTDGAILERLIADGIDAAHAVALLASSRSPSTELDTASDQLDMSIIRG